MLRRPRAARPSFLPPVAFIYLAPKLPTSQDSSPEARHYTNLVSVHLSALLSQILSPYRLAHSERMASSIGLLTTLWPLATALRSSFHIPAPRAGRHSVEPPLRLTEHQPTPLRDIANTLRHHIRILKSRPSARHSLFQCMNATSGNASAHCFT